jgi:hypothetical protein
MGILDDSSRYSRISCSIVSTIFTSIFWICGEGTALSFEAIGSPFPVGVFYQLIPETDEDRIIRWYFGWCWKVVDVSGWLGMGRIGWSLGEGDQGGREKGYLETIRAVILKM